MTSQESHMEQWTDAARLMDAIWRSDAACSQVHSEAAIETVKLLGSTGSTRSPPFLEPRFFAALILSASRR